MKLIYCEECASIFNLAIKPKTCACGKCGGQYLSDGLNAEYFGPAVIFGIGNTSFLRAAAVQKILDHEGGQAPGAPGAPFDVFIIPSNAPTIKKTLLEYKGFRGSIEWSIADNIYYGKAIDTESLISYEGDGLQSLRDDFQGAVDDYLEM